MTRRVLLSASLVLMSLLAFANLAFAATRSDRLLPETTKGYLSIPNVVELTKRWDETQLGKLVNDPVMQPFTDDLKRQLKSKFSQTGMKLGVTLEDLSDIATQELAIALVQPGGDVKSHSLVLIIDVTDHTEKAQALLAKIAQNQLQKGAKKTAAQVGEVEITGFVLPPKKGQNDGINAHFFLHNNLLVATDHAETIAELAKRVLANGEGGKSLADLKAYQIVSQRTSEAAGEVAPQLRWFVEPFGYTEAARALAGGRKKRGTDLLKVLANQGFKAVQGLGGQVALATPEQEVLHQTFIFAPPAAEAANGDRFKLAARVLNFPNAEVPAPLPFVPRDLATHLTLNWKIKESFEHIGSLVDEVAGEPGVFEEVLKSIEIDRNGPQVNLRKELIRHAGERITVMTDCRLPVNTKSERLAVAIDITDAQAVAKAIGKIMSSDPHAKKHDLGNGRVIWEINNDQAPAEVDTLEIEGGQFVAAEDEMEDEGDGEKPMIPNSAVTVIDGHLLISTHVDYLRELIADRDDANRLTTASDYHSVMHALTKLGGGKDCVRGFTRTDEAYRATYELLRQGKMPESESLLGRVLNKALGPEGEGELREQEIDGSKMPEFDIVRRFLGPAGTYARTLDDGWIIVGCVLSKEAQ